jgi:hypothetical protein
MANKKNLDLRDFSLIEVILHFFADNTLGIISVTVPPY